MAPFDTTNWDDQEDDDFDDPFDLPPDHIDDMFDVDQLMLEREQIAADVERLLQSIDDPLENEPRPE